MGGRTDIELALLEHCANGPKSIAPLIGKLAESSTLYRHKDQLEKKGLLQSEGKDSYTTTTAGILELEALRGRTPAGLSDFYPPLNQVPTRFHRSIIELGFAAVIARKYELRTDRHPTLILAGPTLTWKTSCGVFLCHMAGLDPLKQVVNLAAEAGKSLWLRKTPTGGITYKRELLDTQLVIFDEFQSADSQTKRLLSIFTDGRRTLGFENQQLTIHPVPFLTLNPEKASTLEDRLGLRAPQIRRSIIADLSSVKVPDLALNGAKIIDEARRHGSLALLKPKTGCDEFKEKAYTLFKTCLNSQGLELVDFEMLLMLSSAVTAYLEPVEAIRLVFHDAMILFETLGWTIPGWTAIVNSFPEESEQRAATVSSRNKGSLSTETGVKAFRLLESGGNTTGLMSALHIPIEVAEGIVKEYADVKLGDLKISELRRKEAEQERPLEIDSRLADLSNTIDEPGQWKQEHCSHLSNSFCMHWSWTEKPNIPDQVGDPLGKGGEWYVHPTYARCALCPAYHDRDDPTLDALVGQVRRLKSNVNTLDRNNSDTIARLNDTTTKTAGVLSEANVWGDYKMKNCRHFAEGFCYNWTYTLQDGSKVHKKASILQCAFCPAFSQRQS